MERYYIFNDRMMLTLKLPGKPERGWWCNSTSFNENPETVTLNVDYSSRGRIPSTDAGRHGFESHIVN